MRFPWQRGAEEASEPIARSATSARDERISEYLDGLLARPDRAAVEVDAERDPDARLALEGMRSVRASLGELGMVRAPRSFTLDPQLTPRPRGLPRFEIYTRLATVATALVLTVSIVVPSITGSTVGEEATALQSDSRAVTAQAPSEGRKEAADQAVAPPQAPAVVPRSGAPAFEGASSGAGAAPVTAQSPASPDAAGATAAPEPPPPSEQPVPLSNGVTRSRSAVWPLQLALAVVTSVLAALTIGMWFQRRAGGGA